MIQKAGVGGGGRSGPGRALQRSAHLATGDCDSPAPAASCSGVSSHFSVDLLLPPISPGLSCTEITIFCLDSVQHCRGKKKLKVNFFGGQKGKLNGGCSRACVLLRVSWCGGHCPLRPCCVLPCTVSWGDPDELSRYLVPTFH